jgi:hypothetical protein
MLLDARPDVCLSLADQPLTRFFVTAALFAAVTVPPNRVGLERPASDADLLRAYGFGRCLEKAYDKTLFGADAQRVANAYFELGKLTKPEVYDQISRLAESLDAAKPTVVGHHNFAIMACLEFYESAKLKQFARQAANPGKK